MRKSHVGLKVLAVALTIFLAMPFNIVSAVAATATTNIKHKSPKDYIPGFRINLDAEIKDDVGVLLARCYFKTKQDKNFAFVDMLPIADPDYRATLPAPWVNSEAIDYVFVVVNEEKKVVRSQVFTIEEKETEEAAAWKEPGEVKEIRLDVVQEGVEEYEVLKKQLVTEYKDKLPKWQQEIATGELDVKTELAKSAEQLEGFYDNVVVTEVPASMKYGMLAEGLYTETEIATVGGKATVTAATGATTAGTISAAGGIGLGWVALGAAVVAGGAAAASGDDGGGGGGGGGGPQLLPTITTPNGPGTQVAPYSIEIISHNAVPVTLSGTYNGTGLGTQTVPGNGTAVFDLTGLFTVGGTLRLELTADVTGASLEFHFRTNGGRYPAPGTGTPITGNTGDYILLQTT